MAKIETHIDPKRDLTVNMRNIAEIMKTHSPRRKGGKTAFVSSSLSAYGMGRMYEILNETKKSPVKRRVFRTREEAMDWLGL
jgi:hypothetical protein